MIEELKVAREYEDEQILLDKIHTNHIIANAKYKLGLQKQKEDKQSRDKAIDILQTTFMLLVIFIGMIGIRLFVC